jgi:hypothetical protein
MNGRDLRMGEWHNWRQWNMKVGGRRQTFRTVQHIQGVPGGRDKTSGKCSLC